MTTVHPTADLTAADHRSFPATFLWGASTAAHQTEGNNVNSINWRNENAPGMPDTQKSRDACDSFHRWRDDLDLVMQLGLDSYRFSVEWARIEPTEGWFSRAGLAHYRRIIDACLELGIRPMVTVYHSSLPAWFADRGGWLAPDAVELFSRYVETVTDILDGVDWVVTINEPNLVAMLAELERLIASGVTTLVDLPLPDPQIGEALMDAHAAAAKVLKAYGIANVGCSLAMEHIEPEPGAEAEAAEHRRLVQDVYLDRLRDDDFVAVQAYTVCRIGSNGQPVHLDGPTTQMGYPVYPDAAPACVRYVWDYTGGKIPILVTENGIATGDDDVRIDYTRQSLAGLARLLDDGVDLRGYWHWSLLDNWEWVGGRTVTFGLATVDPDTFDRRLKPSGHWYGRVVAARGDYTVA